MQYNKKIIYIAGFLFTLPIALMIYINSSFLSIFINEKVVGLVYALGSIVSILALIISPKIFSKLGGRKFLLMVIALDALSILLFAFSRDIWSAVPMFIIGLALNTLIVFSIDELLKIFSDNSTIAKVRGIYISVCHLAAISTQIAFGTVLGHFSFKIIYIIAFGVMSLFFFLAFFALKNIPDPEYDKIKSIQYIVMFFRNKNLFRAFSLSFLLQFFYCWMIIYTPIYLSVHLGFSWQEIGIIFAIMLLPFLLIPVRAGMYADKVGERKVLLIGFTIATLATISLFYIHSHSLLIWALFLFATRIGASMIEVTSDAYFFKHIQPENEEFVGVYRSADPAANILGPILASTFFIFVPSFNYIYVILGAILLCGIYLASTIETTDI